MRLMKKLGDVDPSALFDIDPNDLVRTVLSPYVAAGGQDREAMAELLILHIDQFATNLRRGLEPNTSQAELDFQEPLF